MSCAQNINCGGCLDLLGCPSGQCPDFIIRRHDVRPNFKVSLEDCDGPLDLTDLVVEFSMWAKARLKVAITTTSSVLSFADRIGFNQAMIGDIIIMDRARSPEHMKVIGFDEDSYQVIVQRGVNGTSISNWKKGNALRIMKAFSNPAFSELLLQDVANLDGTTDKDQLTDSFVVYEWMPSDTCLAGCYWCEFKLLKLLINQIDVSSVNDVTITSSSDYGCKLGTGVEWVRRFPLGKEGYLVQVTESPTAEI